MKLNNNFDMNNISNTQLHNIAAAYDESYETLNIIRNNETSVEGFFAAVATLVSATAEEVEEVANHEDTNLISDSDREEIMRKLSFGFRVREEKDTTPSQIQRAVEGYPVEDEELLEASRLAGKHFIINANKRQLPVSKVQVKKGLKVNDWYQLCIYFTLNGKRYMTWVNHLHPEVTDKAYADRMEEVKPGTEILYPYEEKALKEKRAKRVKTVLKAVGIVVTAGFFTVLLYKAGIFG